jgi:hypothetical protein
MWDDGAVATGKARDSVELGERVDGHRRAFGTTV